MFNTQNEFYHNCGGGIYKTYKKSFFVRWTIDSEMLESSPENTHYYDVKSKRFVEKSKTYYGYEYTGVNPDTNRYKEFVILQMVIISQDYLMCEIILKEDFEKICKNHLDKYDECDNCPLGKILGNYSCTYENFEKLKGKWENMEIEVDNNE